MNCLNCNQPIIVQNGSVPRPPSYNGPLVQTGNVECRGGMIVGSSGVMLCCGFCSRNNSFPQEFLSMMGMQIKYN